MVEGKVFLNILKGKKIEGKEDFHREFNSVRESFVSAISSLPASYAKQQFDLEQGHLNKLQKEFNVLFLDLFDLLPEPVDDLGTPDTLFDEIRKVESDLQPYFNRRGVPEKEKAEKLEKLKKLKELASEITFRHVVCRELHFRFLGPSELGLRRRREREFKGKTKGTEVRMINPKEKPEIKHEKKKPPRKGPR